MYVQQSELRFVKLPDDCTTGSSIMPHKKNPDVFELTRAKCNKLQSLPQQIMMIANNLPSGYFRDLQIIKEVFLPAFQELKDCLQMTTYIMNEIKVNEHILDDDKYLLISVWRKSTAWHVKGCLSAMPTRRWDWILKPETSRTAKRCTIPMKAVSETFATMKSLP